MPAISGSSYRRASHASSTAIFESLEEIESLAPGLYEMKIDNPTGNLDCRRPQYSVRFEERQVRDLDFGTPREAFDRVRQLSELNESAYRMFISPLVRTLSNPWSAEMLKWMHPMRTSRYVFSEMFSPWMNGIAVLARLLEERRTPLPPDNPFLCKERAFIQQVSETILTARGQRDAAEEQAFFLLFGSIATPARETSVAKA